MQIATAHGVGELIETRLERGRTSYHVLGSNFRVWVDATQARVIEADGPAAGPENLFSYQYSPDKEYDPESTMHGSSRSFNQDPAWHVNESNSTTLPYDPTPQYPVESFKDCTIQPGEYPIDADERTSPSDSRTQQRRSPVHQYPGPDPKLFAHGGLPPDGVWVDNQWPGHTGGFDIDADGQHRAPPSDIPGMDNLDHFALPELIHDPGDDEHVYMKWKQGPGKARGDHAQPGFIDKLRGRAASAEWEPPTDMPSKFADVMPSRDQFRDHVGAALQDMSYKAAVLESGGLDPRVAQEMDLVLTDKDIRKAAWRDVRAKAKALRAQDRVHVTDSTPEAIYATVDGDTGTYDTIIVRGNVFDLGGQSVTAWHCGCPWGQWAFKRRLTYVGRMCSHAYATYMEMQSAHDEVGKRRTRQHAAGVVEDFKSWAKGNGQPIDETSMADFVTQPEHADRDPFSREEVSQLYDYVNSNPQMSPQREFDVPYTFDHDQVYKKGAAEEDPRKPVHPRLLQIWDRPDFQQWLGANHDHPDPINGWLEENPKHYFDASQREADALTLKPRSLTPDIQFVPDGEDEHFVDVTKDDRKTTGPGQIMHGAEGKDPRVTGNEGWQHGLQKGPFAENPDLSEDDIVGRDLYNDEGPDIEHFSSRYYAEEQSVRAPEARPDAGKASGDLDRLRDMIAEPGNEHFQHCDDYNDDVRDLVDDLHDAGVDANNLVAYRQFEGEGSFMGEGGGNWADLPFAGSGPDPKDWFGTSEDYVDEHERPEFQDVTTLPDGDILKYNDDSGPVTRPKQALFDFDPYDPYRTADAWSNETSSTMPQGPNISPIGGSDEMGGADPIDTADDTPGYTAGYHYADGLLDDLGGAFSGGSDDGHVPDGLGHQLTDVMKGNSGINDLYKSAPGGAGNPGDFMSGVAGDLTGHGHPGGGLMGDVGPAVDSLFGGGSHPGGGSSGSPGSPLMPPGMGAGAGSGDVTSNSGPHGAGAADLISGDPGTAGAGAGDMASPTMADDIKSARNQRNIQRPRQSLRDQIRRRQGYDTSNLPPGWGDSPMRPDDDDPTSSIPGIDDLGNMVPKMPGQIPGMPGGKNKGGIPGGGGGGGAGGAAAAAEEIPLIAAGYQPRQASDEADIVRAFQASQAGQQYGRGGGGGARQVSSREAAMSGAGQRPGQYAGDPGTVSRQGGGGGRGRFSMDDIAGAAEGFLRTAGRVYSPQEQQGLVDEPPMYGRGARNLDGLDLTGTHYEG